MTHRGPFQPLTFYDSMILKQRQMAKALPAHNKIVLGIVENNAIKENCVETP